jgi:hypothetical protein
MVTVIFVHGISVRGADYQHSFEEIRTVFAGRIPGVSLFPCLWGDKFGASLRAKGASIPRYRQTKGSDDRSSEDERLSRWDLLLDDPFVELRLLSLRRAMDSPASDPRGAVPPSQSLDGRIRAYGPSARGARPGAGPVGLKAGRLLGRAAGPTGSPDSVDALVAAGHG